MKSISISVALFAASMLGAQLAVAQNQPAMSFFVTSTGLGDGANLGGLAGADAHCQRLAQAVGSTKTWRAYLSQSRDFQSGELAVNARDRIGSGPWYNASGALIAADVEDLHGDIHRDSNNVRKPTALDENGNQIGGAGDQPNRHDILTGSDSRGYALPGLFSIQLTCGNWTSNSENGSAMVGHHDRLGGANVSWNATHFSRGCSQANLQATGGDGLFYCFAID